VGTAVNRFLLGYALVVSTIAGGAVVTQAIGAQSKTAFDEIDVERINVREEDGTLRMVISNEQRFPGMIAKGKEYAHDRRVAGMLFFNEEGTENGGLIFSGKKQDGKVSSTGSLTFDPYEQDQVIQIVQSEGGGGRRAALIVTDRPEKSLDYAAMSPVAAMPDGPQKQAAIQRLIDDGSLGKKTRVHLGKFDDGSSRLLLHDAAGRARMSLEVTAEGAAAIKFLDEQGQVVRTVTASDQTR
jgi:hypothetical protein